LGVHFTRRLADGAILIGPSAVLAGSRQDYRRHAWRPRDLWDIVSYGGFWRLAGREWRAAADEWIHDQWIGGFVQRARRYVPELTSRDVVRGPMGLRAQLLDANGALVDDFRVEGSDRVLFVANAPSPAATSSLAIARHVVDLAAKTFGLTLQPPRDDA
jgi:L-2-hydroxyglutarate oxidase LhgO